MKKVLILIMLLLFSEIAFSIVVETASFTEFLYGNTNDCEYDNWISHVTEGIAEEDYNLYSPWDVQTNGFGNFVLPNVATLSQWQNVITAFLSENFFAVQSMLDFYGFPYQVVEFHDTVTGNIYYMLRENLNMAYYDTNDTFGTHDDEIGAFEYGWGLFIYNPQANKPVIITVPHPNDDFITPVIGYDCFTNWEATFLIIAGAGREVLWTNQGNYSNSGSLCDPSRNDNVAFNIAYKEFCDKLRNDYDQREFSAQIHSYDWDRHDGHPDCQVSTMFTCPNLPVRDLSDLNLDLINASEHLIYPANTIGNNSNVFLNDYYAVNYSIYDFLFYNWEGDPYPVNSNVDLPGYGGNRQRAYTYNNWNGYDVFDPFFHLEMDELPGCFDESESNLNWFYGFNSQNNLFEMDHIFNKTLQYYSYWVNAMAEVLPQALELNDGLIPPIPQNFSTSFVDHNSIDLIWDAINSYDFHTYELIYSDTPFTPINGTIVNRETYFYLASPLHNTYSLHNLDINANYFFKIRALDKNENYSSLSEEIEIFTAPAQVDDLVAIGLDSAARLSWTAVQQNGNMGFNIFRRSEVQEFIQIDSWLTNPELVGTLNQGEEFSYLDESLENGQIYDYYISFNNENDDEFVYEQPASCLPNNYYQLYVSNITFSIKDTVTFSMNQFATDYFDEGFDIIKEETTSGSYISAAFYEQYWAPNGLYLQQEVHSDYSYLENYKVWNLRVKTNQINEDLEIEICPQFSNNNGNLYLENLQTNEIVNLLENDLSYVAQDSIFYDFKLYWGDLYPFIAFENMSSQLLQGGDELMIEWESSFVQLIDHFDISIQNEQMTFEVAEYLDQHQENYLWVIPDDVEIHNARIVIDVYAVNGNTYSFTSASRYGFVPRNYTLEFTQGWQLITNPWNDDSHFYSSQIFGENSELLLALQHNNYLATDEFRFGTGYWLNAESEGNYTNTGPILKDDVYLDLEPGWNLVPNPHLCPYDPLDLRIRNEGYNYSFGYAVSQDLIANAIYVYRNDKFINPEIIEPYEAFYLYLNEDDSVNSKCLFSTYYNTYHYNYDLDWEISLSAEQTDKDNIILGCGSAATDGFENEYDLPESPVKPIENGMRMYFLKNSPSDSLFIYSQLNREIKSPLQVNIPESKQWDFTIEVANINSVILEFNMLDLPEGYCADIIIDNYNWNDITAGNYLYSFIPSAPGPVNGTINIKNNITYTDDIVVNPAKFTSYPNPFNPYTTIQFAIPEENNVDLVIYNVKGQRVRTICDQVLPAGDHQFNWYGKNNENKIVTSGIYFIKLSFGNNTKYRKTILLK
ncbi:MAG: T9SS type A sorting domain-containing protein [Candidatus Cloacimonetes bacterium]|nr:T9SS type A sorting domain-containing protein [Candidatus Cloacimonadota bacterium]